MSFTKGFLNSPSGGGAIDSVFGRTGIVTAQSGDYNAGQITNTPAGNIAAVTIQGAINELDTEKAASGANSDITSLAGLTTPLSVAQGGSGASTLTGLLKGNGTSAFSAAIAGTDYLTPSGDGSALTGITFVQPGPASADQIGSPTHIDTLNSVINHMWSSGVVHGCDITDNGDGTVDIAAGYAVLHETSDEHSQLKYIEVSGQTGITLTDDATNYISLAYNSGSPQFIVSTSVSSFNCIDICIAFVVHRDGNTINVIDARSQNVNIATKARRLFLDFSRFIHKAGGTSLSETGTRNLAVTAGSFYFMVREIPHVAFDTSVAGTANENIFTLSYRDGVGGHTTVANSKQIDTSTYDNNAGSPTTLGNNKFGVSWVYVVNDGPSKLWVVMGQQEYSDQASAEAAQPPSDVPSIVSGLGALIGAIVYEKGATSFDNVLSAFTQTFVGATATNHNALAGLQGGVTSEYYHLTSAEYTGTGTGNFVRATSPTLVTPNIGAATMGGDLNANSNKVTSLSAPTDGGDAVNKDYVDNAIAGLKWKSEVDLATTANITLSGEQTIDGTLTSTSRVLVKDQTNQAENGIYVTAAGAWTRAADADTGVEIENMVCNVSGGTANINKMFVCNVAAITLGVTNITYISFGSTIDHNSTTGKQGGGANFYHSDQPVNTTDSPSFSGLTVDTNTLYVDSVNNRVGVGTNSPAYNLEISSTLPQLALTDTSAFGAADDNFIIKSVADQSVGDYEFVLDNDIDTNLTVMYFEQGGNIGIGTTTPGSKLSVNGIIGADGGQIKFPATQNPSADVNTLDDYEEGTWTPTIQDSSFSDSEGQTYAVNSGGYVKIGKFVHCEGTISISSLGTLSGGLFIAGLPFTSDNTNTIRGSATIPYAVGLSIPAGASVGALVTHNSTVAALYLYDSTGGVTALLPAELTASGEMRFSITYRASN